jgi:PIN domain nuclease of toxin-antitoxin system
LEEWFDQALDYPGIQLLPLTPEVATESTRLPGEFHRDPADQMIVATARVYDCPLVTSDSKLLEYSHVTTIA